MRSMMCIIIVHTFDMLFTKVGLDEMTEWVKPQCKAKDRRLSLLRREGRGERVGKGGHLTDGGLQVVK